MEPQETAQRPDGAVGETQTPANDKLVPVGESIKYRRRAQQAETRLQQVEQQLKEFQSQSSSHGDQLATAEAQRDELRQQLTILENRLSAERLLAQSGVVDVEAAWLLLSKRMDLNEELEREALSRGVEQLLVDKPYLRPAAAGLPPGTASARSNQAGAAARLAQSAQKAVHSGDRRDVAEYLRLRRAAARR